MSNRIEATKPVEYDKGAVATNYADEKKMKKINSLFANPNETQKVAFTLDVGNSIFENGSAQPSHTSIQA